MMTKRHVDAFSSAAQQLSRLTCIIQTLATIVEGCQETEGTDIYIYVLLWQRVS